MGEFPGEFDVIVLWETVDARRADQGLSWSGLAKQIAWMSPDTIARMGETGVAGCHHVLPLIQWVGRTPESFTVGGAEVKGELLPDPGPAGWRWYWNITEMVEAFEARRAERGLTLGGAGAEFGGKADEVQSFRRARYGTSISFAMRLSRWLDRTAASFMWEHDGRGLPWSGRRAE